MQNIENFFCLDQVVKIYIPGTTNVNEPAPELQKQITTEALKLFSDLFGGATCGRYTGAWTSAGRGLVLENINIIYSFCTSEQFKNALPKIMKFGQSVCKQMNQDAISLEYNGKLGFIE